MSDETAFRAPLPEDGTEPYWAACNDERLLMQRCDRCQRYRWTPAPICPYCQAAGCTWTPVSGRGRIHTWTVVTHPVHPAAVARVPYVVVEIALDEQPDLRLIGNLVDADPARIAFGARVAAEFVAHPSGQKLPVFRLTP